VRVGIDFCISNGNTLGTAAMQKQMVAVEIVDAHNLLLHLFLSVILDSYIFLKLTVILTFQYTYFSYSQHISSSISLSSFFTLTFSSSF
jgi:hypothetical protein